MRFFDGSLDSIDQATVSVAKVDPQPELLSKPTEKQLKRRDRLATFLNVQLSLVSGLWISAVPFALLTQGHMLIGYDPGGITLLVAPVFSIAFFFRHHPKIPVTVHPRPYGWETIRRRDGRRTMYVFADMDYKMSSEELERFKGQREKHRREDREARYRERDQNRKETKLDRLIDRVARAFGYEDPVREAIDPMLRDQPPAEV